MLSHLFSLWKLFLLVISIQIIHEDILDIKKSLSAHSSDSSSTLLPRCGGILACVPTVETDSLDLTLRSVTY